MSPEIEVIYTRTESRMWLSAFAAVGKGAPSPPLAVASAVIDFGDGTTESISQACSGPSPRQRLQHAYSTAGTYTLAVKSAVLCESGWDLRLEDAEAIQALPAATPSTAEWRGCTTYQLQVTGASTVFGLGNVATLIRLTNISKAGCNLMGYPGLQLVAANGALLEAHVRHATGGAYLFPSIAVGRVALGPGEIGAFEVAYTDVPSGAANDEPYDVACPSTKWIRVFLPHTHQYGTARYAVAPCGGAMSVSPIFPGGQRLQFPA